MGARFHGRRRRQRLKRTASSLNAPMVIESNPDPTRKDTVKTATSLA